MKEAFEQYNLKLLALGKRICNELGDLNEKIFEWMESLKEILAEGDSKLGMFFAKEAFDVLGFSEEERLLAIALFYKEKSTGTGLSTEDAFLILSVNILQKYRKTIAPSFLINGDLVSLSPVLMSFMDGEMPILPNGMELVFPELEKNYENEDLVHDAKAFFSDSTDNENPTALIIKGVDGSNRHFLMEQIAAENELPVLWLTVSEKTYATRELNLLVECALLYGAFVCVSMEYHNVNYFKLLAGWFKKIGIVTDSKVLNGEKISYHPYTIEVESKYNKHSNFNMNLLKSTQTFDNLKIPTNQFSQLKMICDMISVRKKVLVEWGFTNKFSYGNGMSILFYGAPGTGKTMAAGVIANELQLPLYRVDLSQLISKYIGETQKNIGKIFDEAERMDCILLFDEADAIFSKRSDVSDAQDRYSNAETAYLLQRIEQYNGVSILATNLLQNFDEAFRRRISYMVHFPLPDEELRYELWQDIFPESTEIAADYDPLALAQAFELSGAAIKNAALHAAYMAMAEEQAVSMKHILTAIMNEYSKVGKNLSKSQMELYKAYLS